MKDLSVTVVKDNVSLVHTFKSQVEFDRYEELMRRQKLGLIFDVTICDLKGHRESFTLINASQIKVRKQSDSDFSEIRLRKSQYTPDFTYIANGLIYIEEVKANFSKGNPFLVSYSRIRNIFLSLHIVDSSYRVFIEISGKSLHATYTSTDIAKALSGQMLPGFTQC